MLSSGRFLPLVFSIAAAALALGQVARGTEPDFTPTNDNTAPPYLSVYRWDISGLAKGEHDAYGTWLNRTNIWPESHQPKDSWDNVHGPNWQLGPWGDWMAQHPQARFVLSVSILVGEWNLSGPKQGEDAGIPVSLREGAAGTYNAHFKQLANSLVEHGLGTAILRLGWEFNGGWMPWRVSNEDNAKAYAEYWRQIVTTMREEPGADKLQFCWNPNVGYLALPCDKSWPGDEFVDYVGIDIYDNCYSKDTYPWPQDATEEEIQRRREKAWDVYYNGSYGLKWFADFARAHKKPLSIPEWGTDLRPDGHGGGDNPFFINKMWRFIANPENNVNWHCYFDVEAPDGGHQLSPGADGTFVTKFPLSAAKFKELFGLPALP